MLTWLSWENPVAIWWVALSTASVLNIFFWLWTWRFKSQNFNSSLALNKLEQKRTQAVIQLSGIYVFVCAFRSFLPRADVQRISLFDTWFSSVFVGRTVATFAELAFVAQWAIVLHFLSKESNTPLAKKISVIILPIIAVAECFSWYAVIRTHYIGNVIEESLWAVTYTLIGIAIVSLIPKLYGALKMAAQFSILGCILYVTFMVTVDVPMYITRLSEDQNNNKALLGLYTGLVDLNTRWVVTHSIEDWKTEIPWQTLYFTFAVLVSIALCYIPLNNQTLKKYLR